MENTTSTSDQLNAQLKKNSIVYTIVFTLVFSILCGMLIFCYIAVFTTNFYPKSFKGRYLVACAKDNQFYNAKAGNVLHVEKYNSIRELSVGDEVFFAGNAGEGSGIIDIINLSQGYVVVNNGTRQNVAISTIVGKVVQKQAHGGYILYFFTSYVGVVSLNIIIVVMLVSRLLVGFYVEPNKKGKLLASRLKTEKQRLKQYRALKKDSVSAQLDEQIIKLVNKNFEKNILAISQYNNQSTAKTYMYVLSIMHNCYVNKQTISVFDRKLITNIIELMCNVQNFDIDCEYMLTDLILRAPLYEFDDLNFAISAGKFINRTDSVYELSRFLRVLYVLIKYNSAARTKDIYSVLELLEAKFLLIKQSEDTKKLTELANYVKILIKN